MEGGTLFKDERVAIIIVGNVINAKTIPPTIGADLGKCIIFRKIANPRSPKIIEGTAARLLILTSKNSVNLFLEQVPQEKLQRQQRRERKGSM